MPDGTFRYNEKAIKDEKVVGSLSLGLYDDAGLLHLIAHDQIRRLS